MNYLRILTAICLFLKASVICGWLCWREELNWETEMPDVGTADVSIEAFAIEVTGPAILLKCCWGICCCGCCCCKPIDGRGLRLAWGWFWNWLWFNGIFKDVESCVPEGEKSSVPLGAAVFVWTVIFGGAILCWLPGIVRLGMWDTAPVTGSSENINLFNDENFTKLKYLGVLFNLKIYKDITIMSRSK